MTFCPGVLKFADAWTLCLDDDRLLFEQAAGNKNEPTFPKVSLVSETLFE